MLAKRILAEFVMVNMNAEAWNSCTVRTVYFFVWMACSGSSLKHKVNVEQMKKRGAGFHTFRDTLIPKHIRVDLC
jgi:hypothetical protein